MPLSIRTNAGFVTAIGLAVTLVVTACSSLQRGTPDDVDRAAFDDLREAVTETIDNPARQARALEALNAVERDFAALRLALENRRVEFRALYLNYDATRPQFESLLDRHDFEIRAARRRVTESHRGFVAATTDEEWTSLAKAKTQATDTLLKSLQSI
ncbi:MAG: hypothetical protein AAFM91_13690 [Pseudomonadota bacterium]